MELEISWVLHFGWVFTELSLNPEGQDEVDLVLDHQGRGGPDQHLVTGATRETGT